MTDKTLIMTVGLPRSGKSSWAAEHGAPRVEPDAIRQAIHGTLWNKDAEPMVWAVARYMVKALFIAGHDTVILDATNHTEARRDEWKSSAWNREYEVFPTSVARCKERAVTTGQEYLVEVIDRMNAELVWPDFGGEARGGLK